MEGRRLPFLEARTERQLGSLLLLLGANGSEFHRMPCSSDHVDQQLHAAGPRPWLEDRKGRGSHLNK